MAPLNCPSGNQLMKTSNLSLDQAPPQDIPFRFMIAGPVFGILTGIYLLAYGDRLFITAWSIKTVALVHMVTLGWLAMIMMGAFYQMVPVLVGGHVPGIRLTRLNFYFLTLGISSLIIGLNFWLPIFLIIAVILLAIGITNFVSQLSIALFRMKANRPVVFALRLSILFLALTAILGILMIGSMYGWWRLGVDRSILKYLHITYGLIGWVGFLLMGVAFHVIPMFYLTEAFPDRRANLIIVLELIGIGSLSIGFIFQVPPLWLILNSIPVFLGFLVFISQIIILLKRRQRKNVDTTLRFWRLGLLCLPLALISLPISLFRMDEVFTYLFAMLFLVGFASAITNGMLYKIIPFLIWLHRFSSLVGKVETPTMKEILPDPPAHRQFYLFSGALVLLLISSVYPTDPLLRGIGGIWIASNAILVYELSKSLRIQPPEAPPTVSDDDFAAMFANMPAPPPPQKKD